MKKLLPIVLSICSFSAFSQTNYPGGISGCVARWDFSSSGGTITTLNDVSGNGNNGVATNLLPAYSWRHKPNNAMQFDGSTSFALVPDSPSLRPTKLTIISLVRYDGFYSGPCQISQILSKGYPYFIAGNYSLGCTDNIYDGGNCNSFDPAHQQSIVAFDNTGYSTSSGNYLIQSKWYFIATVYDSLTVKIYQTMMDTGNYVANIVPISSSSATNSYLGTNTQSLSIGKHLNPSYPYWFNGAMDELAIFNRGLSNVEIQSIYDYLWKIPAGINIVQNKAGNCIATSDNGIITLKTLNGSSLINVFVTNITGQVLASSQPNKTETSLNMNTARNQILFIKVQTRNGIETLKVFNQ